MKTRLIIGIVFLALYFPPVHAATYTVSNNNDDGVNSLRKAITDANTAGGSNTIAFSGAIGTINLLSALPTITFTPTFDLSGATGTVTLTGSTMGSSTGVVFDSGGTGGTLALSTNAGMPNTNDLYVGYTGKATLNVTNGATMSSVNGLIGRQAGGDGTVTVDGSNSTWTNSGGTIFLGWSGNGMLNVVNGGTVNAGGIIAAYAWHTSGTLNVDGTNSKLTSTSTFFVNCNGGSTGTVTVTNGGALSTQGVVIGHTGGSGTVTVDGANSSWTNIGDLYVGESGGGTLTVSNGATVHEQGTFTLARDGGYAGTLNIGDNSLAGTVVTSTITGGSGTATINLKETDASYTFAPDLTGTLSLNQDGTGKVVLTGTNTYTGGTTINAGTLAVGEGATSALGAGTVTNHATLDLGATSVTGITGYAQNGAGSILKITVNSASNYGSITSTGANTITEGTVEVAVNGYVPNGTKLTFINGSAGSTYGAVTFISDNQYVNFSGSGSGGEYTLTADRSGANSFRGAVANSGLASVGAVLDNINSPSADMLTILDTLESLSIDKITPAFKTMIPIVDAGVRHNSAAALNNFIRASLKRVQGVLTAGLTGISSGDGSKLNGIWAKGYGSYLTQGTNQGIQGYNAWNSGTAVGIDRLFNDNLVLGVSGGYAYGHVDSDVNNGSTNINSAQGTLYAGFEGVAYPYFVDAAGSFAQNWYNGQRDISIGTIDRTADAQYKGQQYGAYLDAGYKFKLGRKIELAPLASIQWDHLTIGSYTESSAGALDLSVNRQSYDTLESGLGARVSSQIECRWGNLVPEVHAKWLYDFISDAMTVTSAFTGGGGSFTTNGAKAPKNGVDLGGKLSFDLKNDISVIAECDTKLKDHFCGVFGSATVRYKF